MSSSSSKAPSAKRPFASTEERYSDLASLGRESYVSKLGLTTLLRAVEQDGLPEAHSRSTQYRARKSICKKKTPYGQLVTPIDLVTSDGGTYSVGIQNPLAMLYHLASESTYFATLLRDTLAAHPSSPGSLWNLIFYQDGVDPSDGLSNNHSRKSNVFYWTFLEFGMHCLSHEECWFTISLVRSTSIANIEGQLSQLTLRIMQTFVQPHGHDIRRTGISLKLHGEDRCVTLFAKFGILLGDEPALKEMFSTKGHSGSKPCPLCQNMVSHRAPGGADGLHLHSAYALSIALEVDITKFKLHSDESMLAAVQSLKSKRNTISSGAFSDLEQLHGFSYTPWSIIADHRINLAAVSALMFDWGHCYVCNGLADVEFGMLMQTLHKHKSPTTYTEAGSYVQCWSKPESYPAVVRLFSKGPARSNLRHGVFNCSASEFLTLAPMMYRYLDRVARPRGHCMPQLLSMLALFEVIELLQAIKCKAVDPENLRKAIVKHLVLFIAAYGPEHMRPKHHYVIHLPDILARQGTLLTTFTQERKHRLVIRYTRNRAKLLNWELGAVEEMTCHQVWDLCRPFVRKGLLQARSPGARILFALQELHPNLADASFVVSHRAAISDGSASVGDAVLIKDGGCFNVGKILLLFAVNDEPRAVVSVWKACGKDYDQRFASYELADDVHVYPLSFLLCPLTHRMATDRLTTCVYISYPYR